MTRAHRNELDGARLLLLRLLRDRFGDLAMVFARLVEEIERAQRGPRG